MLKLISLKISVRATFIALKLQISFCQDSRQNICERPYVCKIVFKFKYIHGSGTLDKSQLSSLDFTIDFLMKLFQTNSIEIVRASQESFCFELASVLLNKRTELEMKFMR